MNAFFQTAFDFLHEAIKFELLGLVIMLAVLVVTFILFACVLSMVLLTS